MAILATETWTGTTGAAWPSQWVTPAGQTGGSSTIQSNRGRITALANYANRSIYLNIAAASNLDYTLTYRLPVITETFGAFAIRTGTTAVSGDPVTPAVGYMFILFTDTGSTLFKLYRNNVEVVGDTSPGFAVLANTDYKVRVQAIGSVVRIKIWLASNAEPAAWSLSYTDPSPVGAGRVWLGGQSGAVAKSFEFDDLTVTDGASTVVISADASGSGTLAATTMFKQIISANFTGVGTASALSTPRISTPAATGGLGTLSVSTSAQGSQSVPLSGTGALTAISVPKFSSSVALSGQGTASATADRRTTVTADATGSGTLTASVIPKPTQAGALSGSGTLSATTSAAISINAALGGSGTLSRTQTAKTTQSVNLSGSGQLTAAVSKSGAIPAGLNGAGTLSATTQARPIVAAALSGSGTLTATTAVKLSVLANLQAEGSLTATLILPERPNYTAGNAELEQVFTSVILSRDDPGKAQVFAYSGLSLPLATVGSASLKFSDIGYATLLPAEVGKATLEKPSDQATIET